MTNNKYSNTDRVTLLAALYQAERSDNSSIFTNALAILGFTVAYVAAVLSLVSATSAPDGSLLAFAPVPACALIAYHQVMVGMNGARAAAAQRIEQKMLDILDDAGMKTSTPLNHRWWKHIMAPKPLPVDSPKFGIAIGEQFLDPNQTSLGRWLGAVLPYAFLFVGTLLFTWYLLNKAADHDASPVALWGGAGVSGILILATIWNLLLNAKRLEVKKIMSA